MKPALRYVLRSVAGAHLLVLFARIRGHSISDHRREINRLLLGLRLARFATLDVE
jgi:hypothetical protein